MKIAPCVFTVLCLHGLCGCENSASAETPSIPEPAAHIDGRTVAYINLVFGDFVAARPGAPNDIKYYLFDVTRRSSVVYVDIHFNHEVLLSERGHTFKGGGARYEIEAKRLQIANRVFYK